MDVKEQLEKIFTLYFQDENKRELLKNKKFDILSDELSELFMKNNYSNKNIRTDKILKNLLKSEFKKILKNYKEV